MQKKYIFLIIIVLIIMGIAGVRLFSGEDDWICKDGQWVKHGNPQASMPKDGCGGKPTVPSDIKIENGNSDDPVGMKPRPNLEIQQKYTTEDKIKAISLKAGDMIKSPLEIEGQARGIWYFEGSFPIKIEDEKGNELGKGIAQAQGEWMTEDFVPFHAVVIFNPKGNNKGFAVFKKDNPSDLEEYDEQIKIPVKF